MAEDGDGEEGSGGDPRMKLLELYSLKTLKQVAACTLRLVLYSTRLGLYIRAFCDVFRKETNGTR